jgi:hypothetical protein
MQMKTGACFRGLSVDIFGLDFSVEKILINQGRREVIRGRTEMLCV